MTTAAHKNAVIEGEESMLKAELIAPVPELLRRHATERGAKIAFRDARRAVTYAALERRTANLAGHLAGLGVGPGDRVAILLPNSVSWVEANRDKLTKFYPLRRLGQPEDIAPTVALLASPKGSWITGQVISISGGFCMV